MLCAWHGHITNLPWPRHEPPVVDLPLELWAEQAETQLPAARFEFSKFVYLGDVPLWAIAGPEMQVFSQSSSSIQYFSELAAIKTSDGERVALRVAVPRSESAGPEYLLLYAVQDEGDPSARIAARPLRFSIHLAPPPRASPSPPRTDSPGPAPVASRAPQPRQSPFDASAPPRQPDSPPAKKQAVVDVKKAIQQTVLGALRLRGVRRDNPDFKHMYHIISKATEFALRNRSKHSIDVNDVHEKVEALLAIVE